MKNKIFMHKDSTLKLIRFVSLKLPSLRCARYCLHLLVWTFMVYSAMLLVNANVLTATTSNLTNWCVLLSIQEQIILKYIVKYSFWCNRSDSCDNDNLTEIHKCQSRKSFFAYCIDNVECINKKGLKCDTERNQCDCDNLDLK